MPQAQIRLKMNPREASRKTVLVFGPQALAFNQDSFQNLRAAITTSPALGWVSNVIAELPDYFEKVSAEFAQVKLVPGQQLLKALNDWLVTGDLTGLTVSPHVPNTLLTPITVLSQLVAYTRYADLRESGLKGSHTLESTETAGFCTGLLAALAVSLSDNNAELAQNGATVLRLAMLVGAVVDAQETADGGSTSVSAVWRTSNGLEALEKILQDSGDVSSQDLLFTGMNSPCFLVRPIFPFVMMRIGRL